MCSHTRRSAHLTRVSVHHLAKSNITFRLRNTSFKKAPFVCRQKAIFCWWRRRGSVSPRPARLGLPRLSTVPRTVDSLLDVIGARKACRVTAVTYPPVFSTADPHFRRFILHRRRGESSSLRFPPFDSVKKYDLPLAGHIFWWRRRESVSPRPARLGLPRLSTVPRTVDSLPLPFDSLHPIKSKNMTCRWQVIFFGGGDGNRTRVRKPLDTTFSGCRLPF